jgi:hypothetical protein
MLGTRCLGSCLLLAFAVLVAGCGSSKSTSSPTSASANAATVTVQATTPTVSSTPTTTAPTGTATQTTPQGSGGTAPHPTTTTTTAPKAATQPSHTSSKAAKPKAAPHYVEGHLTPPPEGRIRNVFPFEIKRKFIEVWLAASGSKASAECMIEKFEERPVSKGKALGELTYLQVSVLNHLPLVRQSRQFERECHIAID